MFVSFQSHVLMRDRIFIFISITLISQFLDLSNQELTRLLTPHPAPHFQERGRPLVMERRLR